jgi:hypothetical protein
MAASDKGCDWRNCAHDHTAKAIYRGDITSHTKCKKCIPEETIDDEHLRQFHIATHHEYVEHKLAVAEREIIQLKNQIAALKSRPQAQPHTPPQAPQPQPQKPIDLHLEVDPGNYVVGYCCYVRVDLTDKIGFKCTERSSYRNDFCPAHKSGGKYRIHPPDVLKKISTENEKSN